MPRTSVNVARILATAVLSLLLHAHVASSVATAGGRGRDVSACVKACNTLKLSCQAACETDCALLFPQGEERLACTSTCRSACVEEMQGCKAKCNVNRLPPSGVEP